MEPGGSARVTVFPMKLITGLLTIEGRCLLPRRPGIFIALPYHTALQQEIHISSKEAYEKKLQSELDQWSAEIDKLKARADAAEADAQLEYYRQIEELRSKEEAATKKLEELRQASDNAWEDLKAGIDSAWDSLGSSIKSATTRFK
jgi:chromosome segregation ATPase